MKRMVLDIEKLWDAFEKKRATQGSRRGLSRERIAARYGLPKGSLNFGRSNKDLTAKVLIPVLDFLGRPLTDFIKEIEVDNNNGTSSKTT